MRVATAVGQNWHKQDIQTALKYNDKGRVNIENTKKRWKDQLHLEG